MSEAAAAIQRLSKELKKLDLNRVSDFYASPIPENIFEWHFTLRGPVDSPYSTGIYHGILKFPRNYPFAPPDIYFLTPNGRFEIHTKICSSVSSYHPELWQPAYDIPLILTALRVFMSHDEDSELGIGALRKRYFKKEEKMKLAEESLCFTCEICGKVGEIWEKEMKGYPAVSAEIEASVPKVVVNKNNNNNNNNNNNTDKENTDNNKENDNDMGNSEENNNNNNNNNRDEVLSAQCNTHDIKERNDDEYNNNKEDNVISAGKMIESTEMSANIQQERIIPNINSSISINSTTNNNNTDVFIRVQIGDRTALRIPVKHIDTAIATCFSIICTVLLKKWIWA